MKYNIHLIKQDELTIDIGDLEGIVHQLDAISHGWGMDFSVVNVEHFAGMDGYIWERI